MTDDLQSVLAEIDRALEGFDGIRAGGFDPTVSGAMWEKRLRRWRPTFSTARVQRDALARREAVGDRMHDFLCKLFASPEFLADPFSKECWMLMQDWVAPPALARLREEGTPTPDPHDEDLPDDRVEVELFGTPNPIDPKAAPPLSLDEQAEVLAVLRNQDAVLGLPLVERLAATLAASQADALDTLRARILSMMAKRGWSRHWTHRSAFLHLEAAELAEAVRGKHGDTLEESADVLMTLLAFSPHNLPEIVAKATQQVENLMHLPTYPGEEVTRGEKPRHHATECIYWLRRDKCTCAGEAEVGT